MNNYVAIKIWPAVQVIPPTNRQITLPSPPLVTSVIFFMFVFDGFSFSNFHLRAARSSFVWWSAISHRRIYWTICLQEISKIISKKIEILSNFAQAEFFYFLFILKKSHFDILGEVIEAKELLKIAKRLSVQKVNLVPSLSHISLKRAPGEV